MPEGPEVATVADAINQHLPQIFKSAEIIENVSGTLHRYSKKKPKNWERLQQPWILLKVRTKGKLLLFDIALDLNPLIKWVGLSTLGMSGDWRFNSIKHKHCRFSFISANALGGDLSFIDMRCFGTWRLVTSEEAGKAEAKIGHDLLKSTMPIRQWAAIQHYPKVKDKPVGEILLGQSIFSGIGNIYKSETLYEAKIDPRTSVKDIPEDSWAHINTIAHRIMKLAYSLNGCSVADFTANGVEGEAQLLLKVYGKTKCPKGHRVSKVKQGKGSNRRTSWFCGICLN